MKSTKKTLKRAIYPLLFVILTGIIIFNINRFSSSRQTRVETYQVDGGWGYRIHFGDRTTIDQPFIPLLPGKTAFPSRRSAEKTGELVRERLEKGIVPVISFQDLRELKLIE